MYIAAVFGCGIFLISFFRIYAAVLIIIQYLLQPFSLHLISYVVTVPNLKLCA